MLLALIGRSLSISKAAVFTLAGIPASSDLSLNEVSVKPGSAQPDPRRHTGQRLRRQGDQRRCDEWERYLAGAASFPANPTEIAAFDWSHFDNSYRGWGKDGSGLPSSDNRDRWTAGNGRIWDWSLKFADTVNKEVVSSSLSTYISDHAWYFATAASQEDCNAEFPGTIWKNGACTSPYLRNAVEIMADGIGNDNGLCEQNETCVLMPNVGSYQGHGNLVSAGTITGGPLSGITLMRHESNGR